MVRRIREPRSRRGPCANASGLVLGLRAEGLAVEEDLDVAGQGRDEAFLVAHVDPLDDPLAVEEDDHGDGVGLEGLAHGTVVSSATIPTGFTPRVSFFSLSVAS